MTAATPVLHGAGLIAALKNAGITHVVSVPDLTTSEGVLRPLASDPDLKLVRICREEEGVGICAGLAVAGQRGAMLIQYTGFLGSMNAIRAVAIEYRQPICMLVGTLYTDSPDDPSKSQNYGVSRMVPLLEVLGLRHLIVASDRDLPSVSPALLEAFRKSEPVVILITRFPKPDNET